MSPETVEAAPVGATQVAIAAPRQAMRLGRCASPWMRRRSTCPEVSNFFTPTPSSRPLKSNRIL